MIRYRFPGGDAPHGSTDQSAFRFWCGPASANRCCNDCAASICLDLRRLKRGTNIVTNTMPAKGVSERMRVLFSRALSAVATWLKTKSPVANRPTSPGFGYVEYAMHDLGKARSIPAIQQVSETV